MKKPTRVIMAELTTIDGSPSGTRVVFDAEKILAMEEVRGIATTFTRIYLQGNQDCIFNVAIPLDMVWREVSYVLNEKVETIDEE